MHAMNSSPVEAPCRGRAASTGKPCSAHRGWAQTANSAVGRAAPTTPLCLACCLRAAAHRRLQDGAQQRRGRRVGGVVVLHIAHGVLAPRAVPHHDQALRAWVRAAVSAQYLLECSTAGVLAGWLQA